MRNGARRERPSPIALVAVACAITALCALGCEANSVEPRLRDDQLDPSLERPLPAADFGLASPTELARETAAATGGCFRYGAAYNAALPTRHASISGASLWLDPPAWSTGLDEDPTEPAFAIYSFDVSDFAGAARFTVRSRSGVPYAGLANYKRDSWDWFAVPPDGDVAIDSFASYASDTGVCYLAVVSINDAQDVHRTDVVDWVRIGADPWEYSPLAGSESGKYYQSLALDSQDRSWVAWSTAEPEHASGVAFCGDAGLVHEAISDHYALGQSLRLDTDDRPQLCYVILAETQYEIRYACREQGEWLDERIAGVAYSHTTSQGAPEPTALDYLPAVDLSLDSGGRPRIALVDTGDSAVRFWWHDGSDWRAELVDDDAIEKHRSDISLALDVASNPRLVYSGGHPLELRYAVNDGPGWVVEAVLPEEGGYRHVSLVLDETDRPILACGYGSLVTILRRSQEWESTTRPETYAVQYLDLACAGTAPAQLCYGPLVDYWDLQYGSLNGDTWQMETVYPADHLSYYRETPPDALALDSTGAPVILLLEDCIEGRAWFLITRR